MYLNKSTQDYTLKLNTHIQIHNTNIYNTDRVKQKIKQRKDTPEKLRPMSLAPMVEGLNTYNMCRCFCMCR